MIEKVPLKPRLGGLRLRDTGQVAAGSATYSRLVGVLRWLLPLMALGALGALIIWPYWQAHKLSVVMVDNVPNLMIETLDLTGIDAKNQPYSVTAERATQAQNARNLINLEKPQGEITLTDGSWITGRAAQGQLDNESKTLLLRGDAEILHDQGVRFFSDEIHININDGTAWGEQPIVIQGSFGKIQGSGFRLAENGGSMIITGPATAKLQLHQTPEADKPNINHSQAR